MSLQNKSFDLHQSNNSYKSVQDQTLNRDVKTTNDQFRRRQEVTSGF